jgi:hypothetical protein
MAGGEFALTQVVARLTSTLELIRVICDRANEENILAMREGRRLELATHYAFALGTVMQVAAQQIEAVQRDVMGLRRSEQHADESTARAVAALESFKRQVRALEPAGYGGNG